MALDAAREIARSVVAISPPVVESIPPYVGYAFGVCERWQDISAPIESHAWKLLRELALRCRSVEVYACSQRCTSRRMTRKIVGIRRAFEDSRALFGRDIAVPVTVAFGDRD
jgi:hypothetical protein